MKYFLGCLVPCILLSACMSYTDEVKSIRTSLYENDYDEALKKIDSSSLAKSNRDKVLYYMERGMILYTMRQYDAAAKDWAKARDRIDELYTVSISNQAASLAINESYSDYEGEEHEQLLVTTFSAIAYFANQEPQKAIVEARKSYEVLKQLNEKNEKGKFSRDAFTHFLAGLIYESKHEWDAAIVEYRNALSAAIENKSWAPENEISKTIAASLASVADLRGRSELIVDLKKKFSDLKWTSQQELRKTGEVFIVYESGKSPLKISADIVLPVQGNIVRVAFPAYKDLYYSAKSASVYLDDNLVGKTLLAQDIGVLAKQALEDRRVKDTARMIARVIAKDQAARLVGKNFGGLAQLATSLAGAVTETADTRSWTFLPDTIQILRVPIPSQKDVRILIKPNGGAKPFEAVLNLKPGEKRLLRYRTFN